ncbi:hypothetical protein AC482_02190 [miscellaneous Crenarchaeota group-15 archaeon DG-45]|uniref:4Fe-4S ferredoxin-type domain-containing protein n=1 Tax=miscellaneous Crenarchaeota group-15 archaeon DG-45 TaxID=1685127 RepID=A0A0M0BR35_9ARCH|nr:MAG: hypothetical protein AC482_02190 [miscellaneous Crenarchaeota group-15 archaeon DG-45]
MARIVVNEEFCKGCKLCVEACPHRLIVETERLNDAGYHPVEFCDDEGKCTGCALCALMCPDCAIEVYREDEG